MPAGMAGDVRRDGRALPRDRREDPAGFGNLIDGSTPAAATTRRRPREAAARTATPGLSQQVSGPFSRRAERVQRLLEVCFWQAGTPRPGGTMLSDSAHQSTGSTAAGGSVATSLTRAGVAPVCSAAGVASPRSSSRRQPDARVVDDNALTQPRPARPDQQPTPGCQCIGGASTDCPPASAHQPGCVADGGPTAPAATSSLRSGATASSIGRHQRVR